MVTHASHASGCGSWIISLKQIRWQRGAVRAESRECKEQFGVGRLEMDLLHIL